MACGHLCLSPWKVLLGRSGPGVGEAQEPMRPGWEHPVLGAGELGARAPPVLVVLEKTRRHWCPAECTPCSEHAAQRSYRVLRPFRKPSVPRVFSFRVVPALISVMDLGCFLSVLVLTPGNS